MVVKGTKIDGVYTADPVKNPSATKYDTLTLQSALEQNLRVLDQSALALARDEKLPVFVCRIEDIDRLGSGTIEGTLLTAE
jgi:uridylate kinase